MSIMTGLPVIAGRCIMSSAINVETSPDFTAHLCARLARMLLANGADAAYTLRRIAAVADTLGHVVHVQLGDGAIMVTAGNEARFGTRVGRALPAMAVDVGRLAAIDRAIDSIAHDPRTATMLDQRLDTIETGTTRHSGLLTILGVAVTAASLARLFGATWPVVAASFLAGIVSTALRRRLAASSVNPIAATFIIAYVSGLVAAASIRLAPGQSPVLCLTAAGMILVPGVPLINGVRDLVDGHSGIAIARLILAAVSVLAIGFALFLAAASVGDILPVGEAPGHLPVAEDVVFSAAAVLGYAMLFDVPLRAFPLAIVCGVASHSLRTELAIYGVDIAAGSLVGALVAGSIAVIAGRAYRVPAVTFAFPGTVAMIPGSYGFRAGIGGLHLMMQGAGTPATLVADTLSLVISTAVVTIAISIGLSLAFSIPFPTLPPIQRKEL